MRILHVNHRDHGGGASVAAYRLHEALIKEGVDSDLLVARQTASDRKVRQISHGWKSIRWQILKKVSRLMELFQGDSTTVFHSLNLFSNEAPAVINSMNPDIVHLHWIGGETLRIEDLPKIDCPVVWTIHDMWPYCGAEHLNFSRKGDRWREGYNTSNRPEKSSGVDWNRRVWERKRDAWMSLSIAAICPSQWCNDCLGDSRLKEIGAFGSSVVIPNAVNPSMLLAVNKSDCRKRLGIQDNNPVLVFGAHQLNIRSKGGDLLQGALSKLAESLDFTLLVFGEGSCKDFAQYRTISLGPVEDSELLKCIYSAADLTLIPSRMESFGLVAAESLVCGTPVVCYDTSGLKDVIDHKKNGYRAKAFDTEDFCDGIRWCLEDDERYKTLVINGQRKAKDLYDPEIIAVQHIEFYKSLLNEENWNG